MTPSKVVRPGPGLPGWARVFSAMSALLLAAAMFVPLPEQATGTPPPPPPELEQALSEVETGEAEAEAEAVAGEDGLAAAGTPCTMRHRRVAPDVDRAFRHRLAAATLATGPDVKDALLAEIEASAPSGAALWRVAMARAELAVRDGRTEDAARHLDHAAGIGMPDLCRSDEVFLRAAVTGNAAQSAELLDAAVAADPAFWAAQEQLAVLAAAGTGRDAASCGRDAARAITATIQLAALATMDSQFERLERALVGLEANGRTALLHGMILRQTGRSERARDVWTDALQRLGPSECDAMLRLALERMLQTTEGDVR